MIHRARRTQSSAAGRGEARHPATHPGDEGGGYRGVRDRLPAFYRENPWLLAPLADVAEDLLSAARDGLEQAEARLAASAGIDAMALRDRVRPQGTAGEVADRLARRYGVAPRVWSGLEAVPHPAGGLEFRPSSGPAAVLAFEDPLPEGAVLEEDLPLHSLPPGVRVQVVRIARVPRRGRPRDGERVSGEIVWSRGSAGACEPLP